MAKYCNDEVLDAALDETALANILTVCSTQPTTRTEAITTYALADVTLTPGDGNGDFVIEDGVTNGRRLRVLEQLAIDVDTTGNAEHIALCDATRLLLVTTCTLQNITQGNTVDVPEWDQEIADAA